MLNRIMLIGNIGNVYPLRQIGQYNTACLNFSMATEYWKIKKDADPVKETTWHNVTVWGKRAERLAPRLQKGTRIHVTGRMEYGSYTDKKTNQEVKTASVNCEEVHVLANGVPNAATSPQNNQYAPPANNQQYAPPAPAPAPTPPVPAPAPAPAPQGQGQQYRDDDDDLPF